MSLLTHQSWEMARKRAGLYCHFHHIGEAEKQHILDKACAQLVSTHSGYINQADLINALIQVVQQLIEQYHNPHHHQPTSISQRQPGYRRAHTGPVLERSSIRAAVLEKI